MASAMPPNDHLILVIPNRFSGEESAFLSNNRFLPSLEMTTLGFEAPQSLPGAHVSRRSRHGNLSDPNPELRLFGPCTTIRIPRLEIREA
jgi:hypothetical protein